MCYQDWNQLVEFQVKNPAFSTVLLFVYIYNRYIIDDNIIDDGHFVLTVYMKHISGDHGPCPASGLVTTSGDSRLLRKTTSKLEHTVQKNGHYFFRPVVPGVDKKETKVSPKTSKQNVQAGKRTFKILQ